MMNTKKTLTTEVMEMIIMMGYKISHMNQKEGISMFTKKMMKNPICTVNM